jgi:hypothetical protein
MYIDQSQLYGPASTIGTANTAINPYSQFPTGGGSIQMDAWTTKDTRFRVVTQKILGLNFTSDEKINLITMISSENEDDVALAHSIILSQLTKTK